MRNECSRFLVVLIVYGLLVAARNAAAQEPPNILFILADDLGYNDLSIQGSPHLKTPNIDAIGRNGVQFTTAYSLAAECSPARAGFLTGKNPATFGHAFNPPHTHEDRKAGMPPGQTILPQTLKLAGYETSMIGKWHLGFHAALHPIRRGFSHFFGFLGGSFHYFRTFRNSFVYGLLEFLYDRYRNPTSTQHLTIQFTDEAIEFISANQRAAEKKPFFMYLAYNAPHGPLDTLPEDIDETIPEERRPYAAMVTRLDIEIGRLMDHLQSLDILNNTLVVFTNDNGGQAQKFASNWPFRGNKGSFLDGGIRVPMLMQWSGHILPGQIIQHPVTLMDMFPTFQEVAAVPPSQKRRNLHGVDLMPYIAKVDGSPQRTDPPPHEHVVLGVGDQAVVRKGPFKLWVRRISTNQTFLYNTDQDVAERQNIAGESPEVYSELYGIFTDWLSQNPKPAFGEELRTNPIAVELNVTQGSYRRNTPIAFGSTASHARGMRISYQWEVFRPTLVHMANFQLLTLRAAPIASPRKAKTNITFTKTGLWTVRVNAFHGTFTKWVDYNLTVVN